MHAFFNIIAASAFLASKGAFAAPAPSPVIERDVTPVPTFIERAVTPFPSIVERAVNITPFLRISTGFPTPTHTPGADAIVSSWDDEGTCQLEIDTRPIPTSAVPDCYNFAGSASNIKINWPSDATLAWVTIFGSQDCASWRNVTVARRDNSVVGSYQCLEVSANYSALDPWVFGAYGSVKLGRGPQPKTVFLDEPVSW